MQIERNPCTGDVKARFEPADRVGVLAWRFSEEEWASMPTLAVAGTLISEALIQGPWCSGDRRTFFNHLQRHIDAHERHVQCFRPGGWDANGAPV